MSLYAYRNILVPVDLSEYSLNALETATSLAARKKARLTILHIEDEGLDFMAEDSNSILSPVNKSDVLSTLSTSIQNRCGIRPHLIRKSGPVTSTIVKTCMEHHCDLIVMGSHGASGYRDGFIGTHTYGTVKYAPCPVLTVPPHKKWIQFRKVVFPVRPVTGALMRYDVLRSFLSNESQLNILGLSYRKQERDHQVLEDITMEISSRIREDKVTSLTGWGNGNGIAEDVLAYAMQNHPDLVVVTSSLDVTNKPHFVGPNAQKIICNSRSPVLNIRKVNVPVAATLS